MTRQFNPLHFIDPGVGTRDINLPHEAEHPARPILVTGTKRSIEYGRGTATDPDVGTIQYLHDDHKTSVASATQVAWFVNSSMNHVIGSLGVGPLNSSSNYPGLSIFPMNGTSVNGVWGLGRLATSAYHTLPRLFDRSSTARSEVKRRWHARLDALSDGSPVFEDDRTTAQPQVAFPAAPWAERLFPHALDSAEVRDKKLELAEAMYNMRRAEYGLQVQAHRRGWGDRPRAAVSANGVEIAPPVFVRTISGRYFEEVDMPRSVREAMRQESHLPMSTLRTPKPFSIQIQVSSSQIDDIPHIVTSRLEHAANYNPYEITGQNNIMSHLTR